MVTVRQDGIVFQISDEKCREIALTHLIDESKRQNDWYDYVKAMTNFENVIVSHTNLAKDTKNMKEIDRSDRYHKILDEKKDAWIKLSNMFNDLILEIERLKNLSTN